MLTALPVEYDAVRRHLHDRDRSPHPLGIEFEVGNLPDTDGRVAIAELGQGNLDAALAVAHAVEMFRPSAILFVGIAGALHDDLQIGDVLTATRVYAYQSGIVSDRGFLTRPRSHDADRELEQRARVVARTYRDHPDAPAVHFRPVAAGDVVLNSRTQPLSDQLENDYNDAGAIEMESAGMVRACHVCRVPALVIRGISDRADGAKEIVDAKGSQPLAARNAADFAVAVIADYLSVPSRKVAKGAEQPLPPNVRSKAAPTMPEALARTGESTLGSVTDATTKPIREHSADRATAPSVVKPAAEVPTAKPVSAEQRNAVRSAQSYLRNGAFSRKGLIEQLSSDAGDGYSLEASTYAVDSLNIDYNEQAVKSAQSYLRNGAFSRKGLIEQLSSDAGDGYSLEASTYAVDSLNIDYNEQAVKSAQSYLRNGAFSRKGLIEQLSSDAGDGYTRSQAAYGASEAGL
ncbi:Nucleoside phosphorylase [Micromonospora nigra]|uniref:Nucleoside phosphorylase n=1 Tax=Micromonospora nigra TaxID=145857 RepID=A0A1C6S8U7_9ACTN|nr:Nucleoside phosphorylase [Micromonospora nigra]